MATASKTRASRPWWESRACCTTRRAIRPATRPARMRTETTCSAEGRQPPPPRRFRRVRVAVAAAVVVVGPHLAWTLQLRQGLAIIAVDAPRGHHVHPQAGGTARSCPGRDAVEHGLHPW